MAVVILCGLATSTILNMFVVPTLYLKYARPPIDRTEVPRDLPNQGAADE